jgi:hypothetical protein
VQREVWTMALACCPWWYARPAGLGTAVHM